MIPPGALSQAAQQLASPIADVNFATVMDAIEAQVEESEQLDFKRELYAWQGSGEERADAKDEIAKDVAAFANSRGGVLIIGVADKDDRAAKAMPVPTDGRFDAWVRHTVAARVAPVPSVEVRQLDDPETDGQGFYLVAVPPSPQRPHSIYDPGDDERTLRFPVRVGRETQWWNPAQVRIEYAQRENRSRTRSAMVADVVDAARTALGSKLWAMAVVVPDTAGHVEVTFDHLQSMQRDRPLQSLFHNERIPQRTAPIVGGIRQHGLGADGSVGDVLIDWHEDGSALAAHEIPVNLREDPATGEAADEPYALPMVYTMDVLLWCVRTGLDRARQAGSYGNATAAVIFWWSDSTHGLALETQRHFGGGLYMPMAGPEAQGSWTQSGFAVTVPIPASDEDPTTLLAARAAMNPLVQRFGLAEVQLITSEGEIDPTHTGSADNGRAAARGLGWPYAGEQME